MPFIIWGSRGISSRLDSGTFFCPQCNSDCDYDLMSSRPFFTIYFIPLFPIGAGQRYVQCCQCRQAFQEAVLEMGDGSAEDVFLQRMIDELNTGNSLEQVQRKFESAGISEDQARHFLDEMTKGQLWRCDACGDHYMNAVSQCPRCHP